VARLICYVFRRNAFNDGTLFNDRTLFNDGTRILNDDLTKWAGSTSLRVAMLGPEHRSSPATTTKSLIVRGRDLSARAERSGRFSKIAVKDPRSVVR